MIITVCDKCKEPIDHNGKHIEFEMTSVNNGDIVYESSTSHLHRRCAGELFPGKGIKE